MDILGIVPAFFSVTDTFCFGLASIAVTSNFIVSFPVISTFFSGKFGSGTSAAGATFVDVVLPLSGALLHAEKSPTAPIANTVVIFNFMTLDCGLWALRALTLVK